MRKIKKFVLAILCIFSLTLIASCGEKTIDYVDQLKLGTSYAGKNFLTDGVGEVKLYQTVDGDTAWFTSGSEQIKIRFVSVDTPESTGQIEPWGKAASRFTANILENAKVLVLEAHDGKNATADSTGTRYLAFIWYSMDGTSDLRNLNLELVQEGYSYSKVTAGSKYEQEFNDCANQSIKNKKYVFSTDIDPEFDYSNGPELNIKEVYEQAKDLLGRRVNFEAIVTRTIGNYAYVENDVDGNRYGMLVYLGYTAILNQCFVEGYKLRVHGFVQEYGGLYQISGCNYNMFELGQPIDSEKYAQMVRILDKKASLEPTQITPDQLNKGEINTRTLVTIQNLDVESIYQNSTIVDEGVSKEMTLTCRVGTQEVQIRVAELYQNSKPIGENYFKGKTISSLTGIVDVYNGKYQIRLVNINDCIF